MSVPNFRIPAKPEDLAHEDCTFEVRVTSLRSLAELSPEDIRTHSQRVLFELCNQVALHITEENIFNDVYSLVNGFPFLDSISRKRLIDSLCSNVSVLGLSTHALLSSEEGEERDEAAAAHGSALKAYFFLLYWICNRAEQEARTAPPVPAASGTGSRGGKAKKAMGHALAQWDWDDQREKIQRQLGSVTDIDLWTLFRPNNPDSRLLQIWLQAASLMLESPSAVKSKAVKEAVFRMVSALALKYQQLDTVSGALVDLLNKHEHLPVLLAELAEFSARQQDDSCLAVEMLREVASVDPLEYDRQQKEDAAGIRNVSAFVQDLADRLPRTVASHISLLIPHLGGKAYALRSAIVSSVGHLIQKAFAEAPEDEADAQGAAARLRSKQHLMSTLVERARDQSAYTRARVMQTWATLASSRSIDMGHWNCVTDLAIGRLEDKSALVRKQALLLLIALLCFNPFAPQLPEDKFLATLEEYKRKLQELQPEAAQEAQEDAPLEIITEEAPPADTSDVEGSGDSAMEDVAEDQGEGTGDCTGEQEAGTSHEVADEAGVESSGANSAEITKLRTTIACMDAAVSFIRAMQGALGVLSQLLASANLSDVTETISLLIYCSKFHIAGSEIALRQMLPLIFSREQGVKDAVLQAVDELYIADLPPSHAAEKFLDLAMGASLGELGSLEEIVGQLIGHQPPLLKPPVLSALWQLCESAYRAAPSQESAQDLRCGITVLSMAAAKQPSLVVSQLGAMVEMGLSARQKDPTVIRQTCIALHSLAQLPTLPSAGALKPVFAGLARTLLATTLPELGWYSAAEAALKALYLLHPAPGVLASAVLRRMAASATKHDVQDCDGVSAQRLSHFFFVLGHVALQQLVHVEAVAVRIRKARSAAEKRIAEAHAERVASGQSQGDSTEEEDIAAQVGVGSAAADSELDALRDAAEAELTAVQNLIGRFAQLVAHSCHNRGLMAAHANLRASALLALTKLMALDPSFCDANLQLVFTLLHTKNVEASVRSNLVIAVGDLAFRFPNLLEPWTHSMYRPLSDADPSVRKNSLMVLSHLILNDMMKVKGHIARLALCLQDDEPRIAALAQLFFHELSRKAYKGTTPIYNLLPDILSNLSNEPDLPPKHFQDIMRHLLSYIGKDKHADSLVDKLCARFEATQDLQQWRNLAFCIAQLNYSEKGIRKMAELFKSYQEALFDDEVVEALKGVIAKAKKLPKQSPDFKAELGAYEERLIAVATERKEEEASAARARAAQNPDTIAEQSGDIAGDVKDEVRDNDMVEVDAEEHPGASAEVAGQDPNGSNPTRAMHAEDGCAQPGDSEIKTDAEPVRIQEDDDQQEGGTPIASEALSVAGAEPSSESIAQVEAQLGELALDNDSRPAASDMQSGEADDPALTADEPKTSRGGRQIRKSSCPDTKIPLDGPQADPTAEIARRTRRSSSHAVVPPMAPLETSATEAGAGGRRRSVKSSKAGPGFANENAQRADGSKLGKSAVKEVVVKQEEPQEEALGGVKAMRSLWEQRSVQPKQPGRPTLKGRKTSNNQT